MLGLEDLLQVFMCPCCCIRMNLLSTSVYPHFPNLLLFVSLQAGKCNAMSVQVIIKKWGLWIKILNLLRVVYKVMKY